MISYGLERQNVFMLGFSLAQNATSRRIRLESTTGPFSKPPQTERRSPGQVLGAPQVTQRMPRRLGR